MPAKTGLTETLPLKITEADRTAWEAAARAEGVTVAQLVRTATRLYAKRIRERASRQAAAANLAVLRTWPIGSLGGAHV